MIPYFRNLFGNKDKPKVGTDAKALSERTHTKDVSESEENYMSFKRRDNYYNYSNIKKFLESLKGFDVFLTELNFICKCNEEHLKYIGQFENITRVDGYEAANFIDRRKVPIITSFWIFNSDYIPHFYVKKMILQKLKKNIYKPTTMM